MKEQTNEATSDTTSDEVSNTGLIDNAKAQADRLEAANAKQEELQKQQVEIIAKQQLAGRAEAGHQPEEPKKQTDEEYADAVMKGEANPLKEDGFT